MEIIGKIVEILPLKSGVSRSGNAWQKQEYILEYGEGQYPKNIKFSLFNEKISQFNITVGSAVKLFFDLESRQFQAKDGSTQWTDNQASAWKVSTGYDPRESTLPQGSVIQQTPAPQVPVQQPQYQPQMQQPQSPFGGQPSYGTVPVPGYGQGMQRGGGQQEMPF